jgi:uncharacterized repeat protein (TIGR03943 family)
MPKRLYRSYQALLLLALCIFLAIKAASGQLTWYINLRFIPFTIIGVIFLAVLAQTLFSEIKRSRRQEQNADAEDDHDHAPVSANLWFMLVPLLIGVLIPSRPLDSSAFSTKGFNTNSPIVSAGSSAQVLGTDSQERNILDWIKLFNFESDLSPYLGQKASVIGFVYFDDTLNKNQFFVSRFVISCCAADSFAIAMVGEWPQASTLKQDSWVLVKGAVQSITLKDQVVPVILAESVQPVPVPEQPYLFP